MTGTGTTQHQLAARSRRVDAVAGERQAVLRRGRARRRREQAARRARRVRQALQAAA